MPTITNIRRPNSTQSEAITIENGLIKGWNLPAESEALDGQAVRMSVLYHLLVGRG